MFQFDVLSKLRPRLDEILTSNVAFDDAVHEFVHALDLEAPTPEWDSFLAANMAQELSAARKWLDLVFKDEPPSSRIRGIWFGLFERWDSSKRREYVLYIAGSVSEAEDGSADWAVQPAWLPQGRYLRSAALASVPGLRDHAGKPARALFDYVLPLLYSALIIAKSPSPSAQRLLNAAGRRQALGFESGDSFLLPRMTR